MILWMVPVVLTLILILILGLLYLAFHDIVDTGLMLLSVTGALADGVICQYQPQFKVRLQVEGEPDETTVYYVIGIDPIQVYRETEFLQSTQTM